MDDFRHELKALINKHNIEEIVNIPDYILADMICRIIESAGPYIKRAIDWHRHSIS